MASNTENLDLLMKNPSTDGADTFNVQTMLNENWQKIDNNAGTVAKTLANILKPTTPPIIGLPPSTTPDGMFRALGNTGELHVWRKTVKDSAGYTLGNAAQLANLFGGNTGGSTFRSSSSLSVSDDGTLSLLNEDSRSLAVSWEPLVSFLNSGFKSKFIICEGYPNSIYYIPQDAEYSLTGNYLNVSKAELVSGYPADYKTTYPVSTNPNAYQEGDDAKEAGYVVGEPKTTVIPIHPGNTIDPFYYGDVNNVAVTDDGVVSVSSGTYVSLSPYNTNNTDSVKGKYIQGYPTGYPVTSVYYIPADATFSNANGELVCDKAQLVTGYAAIPAGTTIEYLGKLGDKAMVQVLSYVGTGTYGSSNPNSLTFDFAPKLVIIRQEDKDYAKFDWIIGMTSVGVHWDGHYTCFVAIDGKKLSFYNPAGSLYQMNENGQKYYAIAIC